MVPASGFIRSHRRESSVDLPQPDGPTIDVKDYSHTMVNIIYEKYQKK